MKIYPTEALESLLEQGAPLARSLDDSESILAHLDIEYVDFDDPAAAFMDPWKAFQRQEPVVAAIEELLVNWGIRPLHLITGQGHHFVWRVLRGSLVADRIGNLAFDTQHGVNGEHERVFGGLALLMEYLAQRVRTEALSHSEIPVELTAVHVGQGSSGQRDMISIDISEYGDPLNSRYVRVPFTTYRKPWESGLVRERGLDGQIGHFVTLPLHEMDVFQCIKARQDSSDIAAIAKRACVRIPNQATGMGRLIDAYEGSTLRTFHRHFYRDEHDPPEQWPWTYDRAPLDDYPDCLRHILTFPNDLLLKPAGIQLATRCLLAVGWRPRHIAGLIRSKFENPGFNWGKIWEGYDPAMRADFYVRTFAGQIAIGQDPAIDFNCTSQQEKGFCWQGERPCSLLPFHDRLITKNLIGENDE
tara:strand:- start:3186 stop:4433 length:1248 start_codon:yes stop_codon:yes gene_type:complete